jgi:diacylglycerol kinase family enzyme
VGVLNGKKFAVMAGVGFDAVMMEHADAKLKHRIGRLAYVVSGLRAIRVDARDASIYVDEELWFTGKATCVLLGQMGSLANGIVVFPDNSPDDGLLDVGVVTAKNTRQWARVLAWLVAGKAQHSPFTHMTKGAKVDIKLDRATLYELDGGARKTKKLHRASIVPGAINVCVPNVATD